MSSAETKEQKGAVLVMETNSSSIVSKRSVERLYQPEPHFFRYFVKKPQRRSPLINRGYWLRMYAIEHAVRGFLKEPSERPKLVINFGCGFDPLPFQLLSREPELCGNARFIDIDYEKLMLTKRDTIQRNNELNKIVPIPETPPVNDGIVIENDHYLGVGCDLKDIPKLEKTLNSELDLSKYSIFCTAEVSLTYMDVKSADALIQWVSTISNDIQFRLLEQYFPDGPNHPFASTMMKHFSKLQAPLYSIHEYPTLELQEKRFVDAGWNHAEARGLWALWSDPDFLTACQRQKLDEFEAFDEWEEFALFASHYFLLSASTREKDRNGVKRASSPAYEQREEFHEFQPPPLKLSHRPASRPNSERRFSAVVPTHPGAFGVHGGYGREARLATTDIYHQPNSKSNGPTLTPPSNMGPRMCHSSTAFQNGDCLVTGGRTSPRAVTSDCWVKRGKTWQPADALPSPRFRHSSTLVSLGGTESVLVYGGKTGNGEVLDQWLLWNSSTSWKEVLVVGEMPVARFGACMTSLVGSSGVLFGGMTRDGVILGDFWTWSLSIGPEGAVSINLTEQTENIRSVDKSYRWLARFGATTSLTAWGLVIIGGVSRYRCIPHEIEMMVLDSNALLSHVETLNGPILAAIKSESNPNSPRPLLTGHASWSANPEGVLIVGGGGVCFSFGTFRNQGTWLLQHAASKRENEWQLCEKPADTTSAKAKPKVSGQPITSGENITPIPRVSISSPQDFKDILNAAQPVILTGLDIGPCRELWTNEYLEQTVSSDRKVIVHEAGPEPMNFQSKNFSYVTKEFGTFLGEVSSGGRQYLRSISSEKPTKTPANLEADFPGLAKDFRLPPELGVAAEQAHSSPLRISGAVNMWLHYDVLANVLCQIRGSKRLILYPPSDVTHLHFPPGASSSTLNIFPSNSPSPTPIPNTHPHSATLHPGDILFIPPLWLHTASIPTDGISIAVNVFFRNLCSGYAEGRDVYANRDLQAYEKGRESVQKVVKSFEGVPGEMARFYIERLADELRGT
ncbi:tRNA methyltransferase ppm2 [Arachnomyces sp. PD_36]|nr:tRNA methyltransferase ppm2 [Arachnomyces sp. PD_36]